MDLLYKYLYKENNNTASSHVQPLIAIVFKLNGGSDGLLFNQASNLFRGKCTQATAGDFNNASKLDDDVESAENMSAVPDN